MKIQGNPIYSLLNKLEENPKFEERGVEKQKEILEVIYKKESVFKRS